MKQSSLFKLTFIHLIKLNESDVGRTHVSSFFLHQQIKLHVLIEKMYDVMVVTNNRGEDTSDD